MAAWRAAARVSSGRWPGSSSGGFKRRRSGRFVRRWCWTTEATALTDNYLKVQLREPAIRNCLVDVRVESAELGRVTGRVVSQMARDRAGSRARWPGDGRVPSTTSCPHAALMSRPRLFRIDTLRW